MGSGHTAETNDAVVHDGEADYRDHLHARYVHFSCANPLSTHLLASSLLWGIGLLCPTTLPSRTAIVTGVPPRPVNGLLM
jgi:hypothetical protein